MAKSKSRVVAIKFERVPVELAKKIAEQEDLITCVVCGDPVDLENCKTEEHGKAVHQNCYIASILKSPGKNSSHRGQGKRRRRKSADGRPPR